jgi:hypothetical protein
VREPFQRIRGARCHPKLESYFRGLDSPARKSAPVTRRRTYIIDIASLLLHSRNVWTGRVLSSLRHDATYVSGNDACLRRISNPETMSPSNRAKRDYHPLSLSCPAARASSAALRRLLRRPQATCSSRRGDFPASASCGTPHRHPSRCRKLSGCQRRLPTPR